MTLRERLRDAARTHVGPVEQSLLIAWAGFGTTFGVTRALTH